MGDGEERVCYQLLRAWRVSRCREGRASAGGEGVGCRREGLDANLGNHGDTNRSCWNGDRGLHGGGGGLENRQERNLQVGSSASPRREVGKARLRDVVMVKRRSHGVVCT